MRRLDPALALAATAALGLAQWLTAPPLLADGAILLALYWTARAASLTVIAGAVTVVETGAVLATLQWASTDQLKVWVGLSGLTVAATVLGISVRQHRALLDSLHERAARLEFERDQEGRLAAAAERARIARELHDIVSHNLTVMIALADGASYAMRSDPDQAPPAIERVSETGRRALAEMRRLLGVLHDGPTGEPRAPQPGLARLDELISQVQAAGIPVTVTVHGDPAALDAGLQLAVFRVAQEALTNTLKHAVEPSRARLALRCDDDGVELTVTDDGREPALVGPGVGPAGGGRPEPGRGLRGMRERAAAFGGSLEAGRAPDGGWAVRLRIAG